MKSGTVLLLAALGILAYNAGALAGILGSAAGSWSGGQQMISWWFRPESGDLVNAPGISPPGPGYRPASETEIALSGATWGDYL